MNKSAERVLKEWALDAITFDAGGKGHLWSKEELDRLACFIAGPGQAERFGDRIKGLKGMMAHVTPKGLSTRVDWESAKEMREALAGVGWSGIVTALWVAGFSSFPQMYAEVRREEKKRQADKKRQDRQRREIAKSSKPKKRYFPSHVRGSLPWIDWNEAEAKEEIIRKSGIVDEMDNSLRGLGDEEVQRIVEMQDKALAHIVSLGRKARSRLERRHRF